MANTMNARQIMKRTATASTVPTIPSSSDHTDGTWLATDIYKGEMFYNEANDSMWTRGTNGIVHLGGRAKLTIPTAQVLTLNSIPVAFGLTVPSGYYVQPTSIAASLDYNSIAYATNTRVAIRFIGAASGLSVFNNAFLSSASDAFFSVGHSSPTGTNVIVNTDIEAYVETGNPTAGNSDITIYLTYVLIKI
jgi:hypothetical protein